MGYFFKTIIGGLKLFNYKKLNEDILRKNVKKCIQYNLLVLVILIIGEICLILAESKIYTKLGLAIPIVIVVFNFILLNNKSSFYDKRNSYHNTGNKNCNKNRKNQIKGVE
jgi:hypothetical protein